MKNYKGIAFQAAFVSALSFACFNFPTISKGQTAPASATPAAHPTPSAVGGAVGTGINAVLTAAFPAAATIINAIWGSRTTDRKTAAQVQPPLTDVQKTTASQIQKLSADLDTVNVFLVDCVVADRKVVQMQDILGKKTTLTDNEKKALTGFWNDVEPRLTELGKDSAKNSAKGISDEYTKRSLLAISETNYGDLTNIKNDVSQAQIDDLRDRLNSLEPKLSAVAALSADIIGEVSAGLHNGAKNLAPSQSTVEPEEKAFKDRIDHNRKQYQAILKDVYNVNPTAQP